MKYYFGDVLKLLVKGKNMTLEEFAKKTGISEDWINIYIFDKHDPTAHDVKKMANVLGLDPDFLQCGVDHGVSDTRECSSFKAAYTISLHNIGHWSTEEKRKMAKLMLK